ncbi:uncharacterized protein LOC111919984 [Lactuca sativa]|uniref:uncharacterized protein LOC111919984 n=1 Tax=Lactuca sativa TaxID=4236 RepID=UPI000CD91669|nr:uncharacterized protein LOC111919984 [Lactuca sativa]
MGNVCILTGSKRRINDEVLVESNRNILKVGVIESEYDWSPFPSGNDDDEGISETILANDSETIAMEAVANDIPVMVAVSSPMVGEVVADLYEGQQSYRESQQPIINFDRRGNKDIIKGK